MDLTVVKNLCKQKGITIYELEEACGFSKTYIYNWKRNTPSVDRVKIVADYFGVSIEYLLGENVEAPHSRTKEEALEYAFRGRPDMKALFSVAENATAEDIEKAIEIIKVLRGKNDD